MIIFLFAGEIADMELHEHDRIPGLFVSGNNDVAATRCIDAKTERALLKEIDDAKVFELFCSKKNTLKRRTAHFRLEYSYDKGSAKTPVADIPEDSKMAEITKVIEDQVLGAHADQILFNEYLPGQGISRHVDAVKTFGPKVVTVSLGSDTTMVFRSRDTKEEIPVRLLRGSVVCMTGESRYRWTHEIPARKSDVVDGCRIPRTRRVSLTFRTVI